MADLDNFFAKKDKKKSKTKKFLTPDEIAKKLEKAEQQKTTLRREQDTTEPTEQQCPEDEQQQQQQQEQIPPPEEEWREFEEAERKDYSGLKIGQLNIEDDDQDQQNSGQEGDYDEYGSDGEGGINKDRKGPWKQVVPADEVTQIPVEIEKPSSKIYISPAFKNAPKPSQKIRNRNAPDITNAEYFPTLGAARPEEQRKKKNEPAFEEVRHGGRMQKIQEVQQIAPVVGNRFKTLDEDDS